MTHSLPESWPVKVLRPGQEAKDKKTCFACGRSWDDAVVTEMTPVPSARCPFEPFHNYDTAPTPPDGLYGD